MITTSNRFLRIFRILLMNKLKGQKHESMWSSNMQNQLNFFHYSNVSTMFRTTRNTLSNFVVYSTKTIK